MGAFLVSGGWGYSAWLQTCLELTSSRTWISFLFGRCSGLAANILVFSNNPKISHTEQALFSLYRMDSGKIETQVRQNPECPLRERCNIGGVSNFSGLRCIRTPLSKTWTSASTFIQPMRPGRTSVITSPPRKVPIWIKNVKYHTGKDWDIRTLLKLDSELKCLPMPGDPPRRSALSENMVLEESTENDKTGCAMCLYARTIKRAKKERLRMSKYYSGPPFMKLVPTWYSCLWIECFGLCTFPQA